MVHDTRRILLAVAIAVTFTPNLAAQSMQETIAQVQPRMVKIFGAGGIRRLHAYSTGFFVSPQGHIATVWSHVLDTDEVTVVLNDGRRFPAEVLGAEPQLDLAVIKLNVENSNFPFFDTQRRATAAAGTRILGFSNMFKVATGNEPVSVIHGVISARTKLSARRGTFETPYDGEVYVVDAITNNPGAGGGVITSRDGQLLGMIGKELRNAKSNTWVNYAIPMTELGDVIEQIITGRYETRKNEPEKPANPNPYKPIDFGLVMVPDVLYRTPAYVDSVLRGSPAARVGLRPDDLILFVNDELIPSCRMLKSELARLEAGDTLRLMIRRRNELVSVEMPVEKKLPRRAGDGR